MTSEAELRQFGKLICKIASGSMMTREESREAYRQVILNLQPELQQGAFLMAHIARGPSEEELSGAWEALDCHDTAKISAGIKGPVCDIVGTGSDSLKTLNCSTPAALITAACGVPVAKKGARLVTGVSGASDILERLGLDLDAPLARAEECLKKHGICYLPGEAFLKSGWARLIRSMRFTSAFNIIGPLTRPCEENNCIVIGAYSEAVCAQLIGVLRGIGAEAALAPFGMAEGFAPELGMDEFSPCGVTKVVELREGRVSRHEVTPEDFGFRSIPFESIASGPDAESNARRMESVLKERHESPEANFFCMNAASALYVAKAVKSYREGFTLAKEALAKGGAYAKLQELISCQGRATRPAEPA